MNVLESSTNTARQRSITPLPRVSLFEAPEPRSSLASLSVRVEQPVQGCAIEPFLLLRGAEGDVRTPDQVEFQWFRSATRKICCNPSCPGRKKFPHFKDATFQLFGLPLPEGMDLFCGTECAHAFWKQARRDGSMAKAASKVAAGGTATPGKGKSSRGGSLPVGSSESTEDWTLVARSKNYSPTPADVGHQLSCRCVSTDHANSCEKTVKTNTVLPQPGPPPPRVLTHVRTRTMPRTRPRKRAAALTG